jgi:hypothetical protein
MAIFVLERVSNSNTRALLGHNYVCNLQRPKMKVASTVIKASTLSFARNYTEKNKNNYDDNSQSFNNIFTYPIYYYCLKILRVSKVDLNTLAFGVNQLYRGCELS